MKDGTTEVSVNILIADFLQRMCLTTWKGQNVWVPEQGTSKTSSW